MASFDVFLQKAGDPASAKVEQIEAGIIGEAWELARQKYYRPVEDPDWSEYQIVRITPTGEAQEGLSFEERARLTMPVWADSSPAGRARAAEMNTGPAQGQPGYVAPQGLSSEQEVRDRVAATAPIAATKKGPMTDDAP